ncbi:MAG: carbamoyltransferase HypF, partial [Pseudomonadota bacterium]|nr:carbamoyltransferase HypF [Pseudomonadota bacterium]
MISTTTTEQVARIRVRGLVQGVGFRPTVWRLAQRHALAGWVANDSEGVLIVARGTPSALDAFVLSITSEAPPLARIDGIEREVGELAGSVSRFVIAPSSLSLGRTGVVADAATCAECLREVNDPAARRFRHPFANCTHCGPRLSIVLSIPYDRVNTTMRAFPMCAACESEYLDPADRRFHAQPIACPSCGPRLWLAGSDGARIEPEALGACDPIAAAAGLLQRGDIVAIKGIGGFQLACDAFDDDAVTRLRRLKRREAKPFALMARDVATVREHCAVGTAEAALLASSGAPIVVLDRHVDGSLAPAIAPGIRTLGVMLPNTPLHHLLLGGIDRKLLVLTSGNLSDEPQCIGNEEAVERLGHVASHFLLHDRDIARRVDDSLRRVVDGRPGLLRGARGVAPASVRLPPGFESAPSVLAAGGELKNTFCLLRSRDGSAEAIVSHHMGDLENAPTHADYSRSLADYLHLFEHAPSRVAVDLHPGYLSSQWGAAFASEHGLPVEAVQHHHAHIAACLAD